jgi:hypothetical protein
MFFTKKSLNVVVFMMCVYNMSDAFMWIRATVNMHEQYSNLAHCKAAGLRSANRIVNERCTESEYIHQNPLSTYSLILLLYEIGKHKLSGWSLLYLGVQCIKTIASPFIMAKTFQNMYSKDR